MICMTTTPTYPDGRTGTDAGWQAHYGIGEDACDECREARRVLLQSRYVPRVRQPRSKMSVAAKRENNREAAARWRKAHPERWLEIQRRANANRDPVRTLETGRRTHQRRRDLISKAKAKPCADCGIEYPYYVMQFDHRDPSIKLFNIGKGLTNRWERVEAEIAKCDVVCANCHMERTHGHRTKVRNDGQV